MGAVCIAFACAAGEEPPARAPRYTLEDLVRIGLERGFAPRVAAQDESAAQAVVKRAAAQAYPHLSLNGAYTRLDEVPEVEFQGMTIEMGVLDSYAASADASQTLYSGGTVRAAIRAARLAREYAAQGTAHVRAGLLRDIRGGFYTVLLAGEVVSVREQAVGQLEGLVAQTRARVEQKTAAEFELLGAATKLANERTRLVQARNRLAVSKGHMRNLVNLEAADFEADGALRYEPVEATQDDLRRQALDARADLRQLRLLGQMLALDVFAARAAYKPTLRAVASYYGNNTANPFAAGDLEWHWTVGAVVEWEVFDGGRRAGTVAEKAAEVEKARIRLEQAEQAAALEIEIAYLDMRHARESVAAAREAVRLAEQGLLIASTRLQNGLSTYLEYSDASLELSTARIARLQALRDHLDAAARLRYASGADSGARTEEE